MNTLSLTHFEKIDGIRSAMLRCDNRFEARYEGWLFDACVDAFGFQFANTINDVGAFADQLVTDCLLDKVSVVDGEAA